MIFWVNYNKALKIRWVITGFELLIATLLLHRVSELAAHSLTFGMKHKERHLISSTRNTYGDSGQIYWKLTGKRLKSSLSITVWHFTGFSQNFLYSKQHYIFFSISSLVSSIVLVRELNSDLIFWLTLFPVGAEMQ